MLKKVLVANATSCLGFGGLFLVFPSATSAFLGTPPVWVISILGASLLLNGLSILWVANRQAPQRLAVLFFVLGDAVWVLLTAVLIVLGLWVSTTAGIVAATIVAIWVGACGLGQFKFAPKKVA